MHPRPIPLHSGHTHPHVLIDLRAARAWGWGGLVHIPADQADAGLIPFPPRLRPPPAA